MEKSKRKILGLIAFIFGVCFLVFLVMCNIILYKLSDMLISLAAGGFIDMDTTLSEVYLYDRFQLCLILISITALTALLLNLIGWLKNGLKRNLIAAILYLLSLNIPSAVLCFIAYAKMKKQAVYEQQPQTLIPRP